MTVLKENSMLSTWKGISYEKRYLSFKKNREQVFGLSETTGAVKYLVY